MTRTQRRVHVIVWLVLCPCLLLMVVAIAKHNSEREFPARSVPAAGEAER